MTQSSGPSWQLFWVSTISYTLLQHSGVPRRTKSVQVELTHSRREDEREMQK